MDELLDGLAEHEERGGGRGEDDLEGEDAVHLPEEVWRRRGTKSGSMSSITHHHHHHLTLL